MRILAFDTSNAYTSVAIAEDEKILAYSEELRPAMQAERLLPMIEDTLAYARLSYDDMDYLGVINGPGSFTGIRTGLAAAMGIALGTKIKVITVSNFDIIYSRMLKQIDTYDQIIILLNAYRQELYTKCFYNNQKAAEPSVISIDSAIDMLTQKNCNIIGCSGSGATLIYDQIKMIPNLIVLPRLSRITAINLCRYVYTAVPSYSGGTIAPLYIRFPDAKKPV